MAAGYETPSFTSIGKLGRPDEQLLQQALRKLEHISTAKGWSRLEGGCVDYCEVDTKGITPQCYCDVCQYNADLEANELYAMEMYDSQGKFPSALLQIHLKWIGQYTQCRRVTDVKTSTNTFNAQYCLTGYLPTAENGTNGDTSTSLIDLGLCMPNSCLEKDVPLLMEEGLLPIADLLAALNLADFNTFTFCDYDGGLTTGAIVMLCITGVILLLIICGSCLEYSMMSKSSEEFELDPVCAEPISENSTTGVEKSRPTSIYTVSEDEPLWKQLLTSFSVISNGARIMDTSDHVTNTMSSVHGIRVLSIWWMILGENLILETDYLINLLDIRRILEIIIAQLAVYFTYAEDSFFLISGLLVTYYSLSRLKTTGKENWVYYYIHRIWRLTPTYYLALFGYMYLVEYFIDGPFKYYHYQDVEICYKNWWTNVLYINNLYPYPGTILEQCGLWWWFIACLMQFYIVTPIIIVLLHKWPVVGLSTIGALIAMCIGCTVGLAAYYDIPASFVQIFQGYVVLDDLTDIFDQYIHSKPYTRMTPYLIGMIVAYILVKYGTDIKINKWLNITCWCVFGFIWLATVFGLYWTFEGVELSRGVTLLHHAFSRFGFSLAVAYFVFACVTGNGGVVNSFLSWKAWVPLSRLSFGAYMMHGIVINIFLYNRDTLIFLSYPNTLWLLLSTIFLSYFAAFFFVMVTEKPLVRLELVLWKKWNTNRDITHGSILYRISDIILAEYSSMATEEDHDSKNQF
ncbi:nose resistant to fluoxetine protein 6-like [Glandiceps talaboti]